MKDFITSIIMLLLAIGTYLYALTFSQGGADMIGNAALYPQIIAILLGMMSLGLLINTLRKKVEFKIKINKELIKNIVLLFAAIILYLIGLSLIGFIPSTLLFVAVCLYLFGGSLKVVLIATVPITLSVYFVFSKLLNVILPRGSLFS